MPYIALYFKAFYDIIHELSLKNAWLPPIFFLDFNRTCLDLHFLHNHTPEKKYLQLVGTILKVINFCNGSAAIVRHNVIGSIPKLKKKG